MTGGYSLFRLLGDDDLAERVERLERKVEELRRAKARKLLCRVRRYQFQQHLGVEGLGEVIVKADQLAAESVLPADHRDQHRALAGSVSENVSGSIPSAFARRYVHDDYVRIEDPNVSNDGARAVYALGVVPVSLKQDQQGIHHVLIVVHNENTSAVGHGDHPMWPPLAWLLKVVWTARSVVSRMKNFSGSFLAAFIAGRPTAKTRLWLTK
jgi:hypothetical protein